MSSSAIWTYQYNLGNIAPSALSTALKDLQTVANNCVSVLNVVEKIIKIVSVFMSAPTDILSIAIKEGSVIFITAIKSLSSLGGQFIVITPFNSIGQYYTDIGTKAHPWPIPSLSPRQAFSELQASFYNTKDPYRPQWTSQTQVTGYGLLICAPDPVGLVKVSIALTNLFDMDPFNKIITGYLKQIESNRSDANSQGNSTEKLKFDISDITTLFKDIQGNVDNPLGAFSGVKPHYTSLPSLHWYGLTIANFKILQQIIDRVEALTKYLLNITESTSNAILELARALISKVENLKDIINIVLVSVSNILISVNNTGIYSFVVPKNYGGVDYVIKAINTSINNPTSSAAKEIANIQDTTQYSTLFFAGAGTGVDLDAFNAMLGQCMRDMDSVVKVLNSSVAALTNYTVIPNFSSEPVFTYGSSFTLTVVSNDSTIEDQYYYTYEITSDYSYPTMSAGTVISSFDINSIGQSDKMAKVNLTSFTITLPQNIPDTISRYTIKITIFDYVHTDATYTGKFLVTNLVSSSIPSSLDSNDNIPVTGQGSTPNRMLDDIGKSNNNNGNTLNNNITSSGGSVSTIKGSSGLSLQSIPIVGSSGLSLQSIPIVGSSPISSGGILTPNDPNEINSSSFSGSNGDSIKISDDSGNSLNIPIVNNSNFSIITVSSPELNDFYYFATFPAKLKLTWVGAISYRKIGTTTWTTMTAPDYITFTEPADYDYQIFTIQSGMGSEKIVHILQGNSSDTKVC
jgi:hypothetical protein